MTDQIANMFSKIMNAIMSSNTCVDVVNSKVNCSILDAMKEEGYIESYNIKDKRQLTIKLRYDLNGVPAIRYLRRVSKLSKRIYASAKELMNPKKSRLNRIHKFSTFIVSTSQGVVSDFDAISKGIGGEVMCEVAS